MKKVTFLVLAALLPLAVKSPEQAIALDAEITQATTTQQVFEASKVKEVEVEAVVAPVEAPKTNREVAEALAAKYAAEYGVDEGSLMRTLTNENRTFEPCLQSGLTYKAGNRWGFAAGTREKSFGLAQIHLPDHPTITKEQACDPDFSVRFMAKKFSEGRQRMWMGYVG